MDRKPRNVACGVRTLHIATIIVMLVFSTLGCLGEEKKPEWSFGEKWYWKAGMADRSVAVGDVDGDGVPELITGGDILSEEWYTVGRTTVYGPHPKGQVRIWHWTGATITLEQSEEWDNAKVYSVVVGDGDGDGILEIITGGRANIGTGGLNGQLRIWHWTGGALVLEYSKEWLTGADTEVRSVILEDVDGDGVPELITGGFKLGGLDVGLMGQLRIWHWTGSELALEHSEEWTTGYNTRVNSVCVGDVDGDGALELITGGCTDVGTRLRGQLRIWNWTEGTLTLEWNEEWSTRGDTYARSVAVGDVDGDGIPELITGSLTRVWTRVKGQLRIWHWTGGELHLEHSEEWATDGDTAVWSVVVGDVDGDSVSELITGGFAHISPHLTGQLRIWHWTKSTLTLEHSEEWATDGDTAVWSVEMGDVDGDGVLELITGGVVGTADRGIIIGDQPPPEVLPFKSQLRIWYWTGATLILAQSKEWDTVANT